MSTISLKFGVHTRNWNEIGFHPLEFNFEFYKPVQDHKKSFKIIILTDVRLISLKKPTKMH